MLSRTGQSFVPPKYEDFCCPVCGSKEYKQVTQSNGILGPGGRSWLAYNVCSGCSVRFEDAKKFTKAKK